jgi:hypothetical protein
MRHKPSFVALISLVLWGAALASTGCAPKLGDGCKQGIDCDVRNQRICDRTQPGGYCTIPNCKPGDCGDEGVCVRFRPDEPRLSVTYCMAECSSTSDCDRDAYVCRSAESLNTNQSGNTDNEGGESTARVAEVLDGKGTAKFCTAKGE